MTVRGRELPELMLGLLAIAVAAIVTGYVVADAILGAQRGEVKYPEFVDRTMRAGCIGYVTWIAGCQVTLGSRS